MPRHNKNVFVEVITLTVIFNKTVYDFRNRKSVDRPGICYDSNFIHQRIYNTKQVYLSEKVCMPSEQNEDIHFICIRHFGFTHVSSSLQVNSGQIV